MEPVVCSLLLAGGDQSFAAIVGLSYSIGSPNAPP